MNEKIEAYMISLGFVWYPPGGCWDNPQTGEVTEAHAEFFYRASTKAERRGEVHQLKMLKHWAELHDITITVDDLDHFLASLEQFPDQPLARENLEALAAQRAKYKPNEDKSDTQPNKDDLPTEPKKLDKKAIWPLAQRVGKDLEIKQPTSSNPSPSRGLEEFNK